MLGGVRTLFMTIKKGEEHLAMCVMKVFSVPYQQLSVCELLSVSESSVEVWSMFCVAVCTM